jgi:hypothetical protein
MPNTAFEPKAGDELRSRVKPGITLRIEQDCGRLCGERLFRVTIYGGAFTGEGHLMLSDILTDYEPESKS